MQKSARIRLLCGSGLLAGVALSPRLWGLGPRSFPRVPVAGPPLPAALEAVTTLVLVGGLIASAWRPRLRRVAACAALLLAWTDQQRWQPWAWEHLLVGVLAGGELLPARLILGGVIFWAGFWKLGPGYRDAVAPWLAGPLPLWLRPAVPAIPYFELLTGAALLIGWRQQFGRGVARSAVLTMHAGALALLMPRGWNAVVWPWQVASAAIAWIALGPGDDWPTAPTAATFPPPSGTDFAPVPPPAPDRRDPSAAAWLAVALALLLPAAWPLGVVNTYLAWRLYTGDPTDVALQQWSLRELSVPLSPSPWRVRRCLPPTPQQP